MVCRRPKNDSSSCNRCRVVRPHRIDNVSDEGDCIRNAAGDTRYFYVIGEILDGIGPFCICYSNCGDFIDIECRNGRVGVRDTNTERSHTYIRAFFKGQSQVAIGRINISSGNKILGRILRTRHCECLNVTEVNAVSATRKIEIGSIVTTDHLHAKRNLIGGLIEKHLHIITIAVKLGKIWFMIFNAIITPQPKGREPIRAAVCGRAIFTSNCKRKSSGSRSLIVIEIHRLNLTRDKGNSSREGDAFGQVIDREGEFLTGSGIERGYCDIIIGRSAICEGGGVGNREGDGLSCATVIGSKHRSISFKINFELAGDFVIFCCKRNACNIQGRTGIVGYVNLDNAHGLIHGNGGRRTVCNALCLSIQGELIPSQVGHRLCKILGHITSNGNITFSIRSNIVIMRIENVPVIASLKSICDCTFERIAGQIFFSNGKLVSGTI